MRVFSSPLSSSFSSMRAVIVSLLLATTLFMGSSSAANSCLSFDFYKRSCPKVFSAVRSVVESAVAKEKRMGASLLRLHFHDCFVQGCDGSILLDDTTSFTGEKTAIPNNNSIRGYEVVDAIKSKVEAVCPGVVSCADIAAIAARDSVVILGGPNWKVKVGRRDSKTASLATANSGVIPPPTATLTQLINRFNARGLSAKDMVVLSGAHTIGQAKCSVFRNRIYNETNIDPSFADLRRSTCPRAAGSGDGNLAPFDLKTPTFFDNSYFKLLLDKKGLLHSDQILYDGGSTDSLVEKYSKNPKSFDHDFVAAMIRMGNISPLTGSDGEVRKNCRKPN